MGPLPLPDGCTPFDWVGVSQAAFNEWANAHYITAEPFLRHLRAYLAETPITYNQRQLLTAVLCRCGEEWAETPQPGDESAAVA